MSAAGFRLYPSLFDGDDALLERVDRGAWQIRDGRLSPAIPAPAPSVPEVTP